MLSRNDLLPKNIHAAASEEDCKKMGQRYVWKLLRTRDSSDQLLSKDFIFEGQRVSFQEMGNDYQD